MTTITQNEALCMFFSVAYNKENVKDCKEKLGSCLVMGYPKQFGDQFPSAYTEDHFNRFTLYEKYPEDKEDDCKESVKRLVSKYLLFFFWKYNLKLIVLFYRTRIR